MENGVPNWPNVSFPKVPESDEENICRNTSNSEEKIVPFKESLEQPGTKVNPKQILRTGSFF
jgi:hypothetical protein